jgi:hypothetical protein
MAGHESGENGQQRRDIAPLKQEPPPLLAKLSYAAHIYSLQSFINPYLWVREWKEYFYPPDGGPNIIKRYEVRPHLPIR